MALKASSQSLIYHTYDLEFAKLLIAAGADVNAKDHLQQSALHWASILHCPEDFFLKVKRSFKLTNLERCPNSFMILSSMK